MRIALDTMPAARGSIVSCLANIGKKEGIRALYFGLPATIAGIIPFSSMKLATYDMLRRRLTEGVDAESISISLAQSVRTCTCTCHMPHTHATCHMHMHMHMHQYVCARVRPAGADRCDSGHRGGDELLPFRGGEAAADGRRAH